MAKKRRLDKSEMTDPSSAFDLFYNSIKKRLDFDIFDSGVTRFNAVVLTQPILLSPNSVPVWKAPAQALGVDSLSLGKFKFFARIQGLNSPHAFLPDPCDPEIADDPTKQLEFIKLHTEFYSTKDSSIMRPKVGDTIVVELQQNAFSYNLYVGEYVKLLDSTGGNRSVLIDCSGLSSNFVNMGPGWTVPGGAAGKGAGNTWRNIDFGSVKLTANCKPNKQDASEIKKYFGQKGYDNFIKNLAAHEGTYGERNSYGYLGRYQFGIEALEGAGFMVKGQGKKKLERCFGQAPGCEEKVADYIDDPANWTGFKGVKFAGQKNTTAPGSYIVNEGAQDYAVWHLTNSNFNYLKNEGALDLDNPNDVAGMLAAAHLRGAGGAKSMRNGREKSDANGTYPSKYYKEMGEAYCDTTKVT